jgi:hypothetical protein
MNKENHVLKQERIFGNKTNKRIVWDSW